MPIYSRKHPDRPFKLRELTIDPEEYDLITIRAVGPGPGRGRKSESGEGLRTIRRLNIKEALEDPQFFDLANQTKSRFIQIVRSYLRAGVISLEDLM